MGGKKIDPRTLPPLDLNQRYSIDESSAYLRISRVHLYKKVRAGELRLLRDGGRSFLTGSEIAAASRMTGEQA